MKKKDELILEVIDNSESDDNLVLEMANILREDHPELPSNVYISPKQGDHGPRIKVQLNDDGNVESHNMAPITISNNPTFKGNNRGKLSDGDINYFREWILRNKDVLLAYWNGTMQIERVLKSLQY